MNIFCNTYFVHAHDKWDTLPTIHTCIHIVLDLKLADFVTFGGTVMLEIFQRFMLRFACDIAVFTGRAMELLATWDVRLVTTHFFVQNAK